MSTSDLFPPGLRGQTSLMHLRPSTPLELLDRIFALLRIQAPAMAVLGLAAAVLTNLAGPLLLIHLETSVSKTNPGATLSFLGLVAVSWWPLSAALIIAFQTLLLPRRPIPITTALRAAFIRLPNLILTNILMYSILLSLLILPAAGLLSQSGAVPASPGVAGGSLLLPVFLVVGIYLALLWALVTPVVLLEGKSFFEALGRSAQLMRRRFSDKKSIFSDSPIRRVLLIGFLYVLISGVSENVVYVAYSLATGQPLDFLSRSPADLTPVWGTVQIELAFLSACVAGPFLQAALAALYAETRMRSEGLDLQARLLSREEATGRPTLPNDLLPE